MHFLFTSHAKQDPPQSVSVSSPSFIVLKQCCGCAVSSRSVFCAQLLLLSHTFAQYFEESVILNSSPSGFVLSNLHCSDMFVCTLYVYCGLHPLCASKQFTSTSHVLSCFCVVFTLIIGGVTSQAVNELLDMVSSFVCVIEFPALSNAFAVILIFCPSSTCSAVILSFSVPVLVDLVIGLNAGSVDT